MKIEGNKIYADQGMAIHRKGEPSPSLSTFVSLSSYDKADDFEDCEYGEPQQNDVTEADKDAALRRFGVEV